MKTSSIKDLMFKHIKRIIEITYPYADNKQLKEDTLNSLNDLSDQ